MSGECDKCGEHALECKCFGKYFTDEAKETLSKWKREVLRNSLNTTIPVEIVPDDPKDNQTAEQTSDLFRM